MDGSSSNASTWGGSGVVVCIEYNPASAYRIAGDRSISSQPSSKRNVLRAVAKGTTG
jgi:hypothetical protein